MNYATADYINYSMDLSDSKVSRILNAAAAKLPLDHFGCKFNVKRFTSFRTKRYTIMSAHENCSLFFKSCRLMCPTSKRELLIDILISDRKSPAFVDNTLKTVVCDILKREMLPK